MGNAEQENRAGKQSRKIEQEKGLRIAMVEAELLQALKNQDKNEVERLLLMDPPAIDGKDEEGIPFLFVAALTGNFEVVKYLVEYSRASLNLVDHRHRTVLHFAAMSGNVEMCKYLVERAGMSITEGDLDLDTPFAIAYRQQGELLAYFEKEAHARYEDMYRNPIRTGFFPDPSIVRVGEDYYMVNSSFIYFPCIPISHSKDLVNWKIIGHAITNPKWAMLEELEGGRGYWAPDISYDNGTFYITATYRLNDGGPIYRKQIVVSSKNPEGPYSRPAVIDEDGIDPSIFHEDGRHYMLLNRGARIFELNEDCTRQISPAQMLFYGDYKRAPEGPHLLKKDGYYYLFEAEGGTGPGHRVTVSRSRELMGRYEPCPYNPILRQTDEAAPLQRAGHGKPVCTPEGNWYMVYLCGRTLEVPDTLRQEETERRQESVSIPARVTILGRETALDPITWTADGWPIVNHLQGPSVLQKRPYPKGADAKADAETDAKADAETDAEADVEAGGTASTLLASADFVSPRAPEEGGVRISRDGYHLLGSRAPLYRVDARNQLLRRQTSLNFTAEAVLATSPREIGIGQQAGLTCYYDENSWVNLYLTRGEDGKLSLELMENIGQKFICHNLLENMAALESASEPLVFGVHAQGLKRTFYLNRKGRELAKITLPCVYYLSDEGVSLGKRFTGAMVGMFGYRGAGELKLWFSEFRYEEN